jgi:GTP-binding protein EngB required for normal cell division
MTKQSLHPRVIVGSFCRVKQQGVNRALLTNYSTKHGYRSKEKLSNSSEHEKNPPVPASFDSAMTESEFMNAIKRITRSYKPEQTKDLVELIQKYSKNHSPLTLSLLSTTLKALHVYDLSDHVVAHFQDWCSTHEANLSDHLIQNPNATLRIVGLLSEINQVQLAVTHIQTPLNYTLFALPPTTEIQTHYNNLHNSSIPHTPPSSLPYTFPSKWTNDNLPSLASVTQLQWMIVWYQDILARIALGQLLNQQYSTFRHTLQQMLFLQDQFDSYYRQHADRLQSIAHEIEQIRFQFSPDPLKSILKILLKSSSSSSSTSSALTSSRKKEGVPMVSADMLEYFQLLIRLDPHSMQSNDILQLYIGNYFHQIQFVKGAVSMDTLPSSESRVLSSQVRTEQKSTTDRNQDKQPAVSEHSKNPYTIPEYIFIGRSNVGKSSLINMLTNRKQLAFTSKLAGKTTEFNYYLIQNAIAAAASEQSSSSSKGKPLSTVPQKLTPQAYSHHALELYLVDLPGVGYAKRSQQLISSWTELLQEYVQTRDSLQSIFHLIDSRHGLLEADYDCLALLSKLPSTVDYVIVFTKIDKQYGHVSNHVKNPSIQAQLASYVHPNVIQQVEAEVKKYRGSEKKDNDGMGKVKMFYTSSITREGGMDLMQYILSTIVQRRTIFDGIV